MIMIKYSVSLCERSLGIRIGLLVGTDIEISLSRYLLSIRYLGLAFTLCSAKT